MYTKIQLGLDLKQLLTETNDVVEIARRIFSLYFKNVCSVEDGVREVALNLNFMECGPEFAYSIEELNDIADALISGEEIKLD